MHQSARGVTALDLIITLAIVTLLVSAGVPAFRAYGLNQRMSAAVARLQADLQFARSEAIRLDARTLACPGSPGEGCRMAGDWDRGWITFADLNGDRTRQPEEPLLRSGAATEGLSITSSDARRKLRYSPNGSAPGSNATITFCDSRGAAHARQIRVSSSGRIRQVRADGDTDSAC